MSPNIVSRAAAGIRKNMSALAEACSLFRSRAREVARACGEPRARVSVAGGSAMIIWIRPRSPPALPSSRPCFADVYLPYGWCDCKWAGGGGRVWKCEGPQNKGSLVDQYRSRHYRSHSAQRAIACDSVSIIHIVARRFCSC